MPYKIIRTKTVIPLRRSNRRKSQLLMDFATLSVGNCMQNLTKQEYNATRNYSSRYKVKVTGRLQTDGTYTVWRIE